MEDRARHDLIIIITLVLLCGQGVGKNFFCFECDIITPQSIFITSVESRYDSVISLHNIGAVMCPSLSSRYIKGKGCCKS